MRPVDRLAGVRLLLRRWALPLLLGAAGAVEASTSGAIARGSGLPAVFAAAMALPLGWRAARPLGALVSSLAVFTVQEVWGAGTLSEAVLPFVTLVVAMYSAGARLRGHALAAAVAASCTAVGGTIVLDARGPDTDSLVYAAVVIAAAFTAGRLIGQRSREADRLTAENARLEIEREAREKQAVARERMRIAQELHDLITHRVSAMVLQASTERRVAERGGARPGGDTAALASALASIETLGREAMNELRQLLGALFHDGDGPLTPQPGVAQLPDLVAQTSAADVVARLQVLGTPRELPEPLQVSVYRLAQEALSNAMRHAPGSEVSVELRYLPETVELTVLNTAPRRPESVDPGLGLGLPGMRERARQFGGELEAVPADDGGFLVRARLPAPASPDPEET